jgi:hypothetical protein
MEKTARISLYLLILAFYRTLTDLPADVKRLVQWCRSASSAKASSVFYLIKQRVYSLLFIYFLSKRIYIRMI